MPAIMKISKFFILSIFLQLLSYCNAIIDKDASTATCSFPWSGQWIGAEGQVEVTRSEMGAFGVCAKADHARGIYLLSTKTDRGICYRCVSATLVHRNVLQYKKTSQCIFDPDMEPMKCAQVFTADVPLNTLFRKEADSIPCPLDAPLNFTYVESGGVCESRTSTVRRCAEWNRLSVRFEACPEYRNRETSVSELECMGQWETHAGSFFAARVADGNGIQHRCFMQSLSRSGTSGRLGISADSSCLELTSIEAATTRMTYKMDARITADCHFPHYMSKQEGRRERLQWDSVVTGQRHKVRRGDWVSSYGDKNDTVMTCLERKDRGDEHFFRVHVSQDCNTGYQCVKVVKRKKNVVLLEFGGISQSEFDDCTEMSAWNRDTLVTKIHGQHGYCPSSVTGRYFHKSCDDPLVTVDCSGRGLTIERECPRLNSDIFNDKFTCLAHIEAPEETSLVLIRNQMNNKLHCLEVSKAEKVITRVRLYDGVSCDIHSVRSSHPSRIFFFDHQENCNNGFLSSFWSTSSFPTFNLSLLASVYLFFNVIL